jgi:hypothetical protein
MTEPLFAGAVQVTDTWVLPRIPTTLVGAFGTVAGVTATEGVEAAEVPTAFVAVTVNVYAVPFVSPVTVQLVVADVQVRFPGDDVTVYNVIAAPPLVAGADHETATWALPLVPVALVGTPGIVAGVTAADEAEIADVPTSFVAVTVKVYEVPFARPVTRHGETELEQVTPSGFDVTVYEVIADPLLAGAVQATDTWALPRVPTTFVGALGTPAGVIALDAADTGDCPTKFVARTVKV